MKPTIIPTGPFTGSLAPTFDDPIGVLVACHGRMEQRLQILELACRVLQVGEEQETLKAIDALPPVVAYFTSGGVKHTEDEEMSLFPRMRQRLTSGDEAREALALLESQHRESETFIRELVEVVARLCQEPMRINRTDLEKLQVITRQMSSQYRPHIQLENEVVFPRALEILSSAELAVIGKEMARRRNLTDPE